MRVNSHDISIGSEIAAPASFKAWFAGGLGLWIRGRQSTTPILAMFRLWSERHRHRMYLAEVAALGERTMLDLGFDPDIVRAEAAKPFWRA